MENAVDGFDDKTVSRAVNQEIDTETALGIANLKSQIKDKIAGASAEGVISKADVGKLHESLHRAEGKDSSLQQVSEEVSRVISESKDLLGRFIGEVHDPREMVLFREKSLEAKRDYIAQLEQRVKDLQRRIVNLKGALSLQDERKMGELSLMEREMYVSELETRNDNVTKYFVLLDRYSKHFSPDSLAAFRSEFKDLSTVERQKEWIAGFEETQARPRELLSNRFQALPNEYRDEVRNFYNLSRHEKADSVLKLEENFAFDKVVDESSFSKKVASESREFAKRSFKEAPAPLRDSMKKTLAGFMQLEAGLTDKFEKLPSEVQARYAGFREFGYEKKDKILQSLDKHEGLRGDYEKMIGGALKDKLISQGTYNSYFNWFVQKSLDDKRAAISDFSKEMEPRKNLKIRFEGELSSEVRKDNARFYEFGMHDRMELFEKLRAEAENKAKLEVEKKVDAAGKAEVDKKANVVPENKDGAVLSKEQLNQMTAKAREFSANGNAELAKSLYQTVLIYDAKNEEALAYLGLLAKPAANDNGADSSDSKIRESVNAVKQESGVKRMVKLVNVAEGVAQLAYASDLQSGGVIDSEKKDNHLGSEKEKILNRQVLEFTSGKMKLGRKSTDKAREIKRVDITRLDKIDAGDVNALKDVVISHEGESRKDADNVQLVKESGVAVAGSSGVHCADKMKRNLRKGIAVKAEERLRAGGHEVSEIDRAKMKAQLEKDALEVDLREAA
jgi:hypothetical protein